MYGANFNTNSGDSVYTFSQTTGEMFINGVGQGAPSGNKIFLTIWDGGGNDTIDVSNYTTGVTVDLRPGEFSTFDQAQLANNLAYQNLTNLAPGNIAMSLLYNNDTAVADRKRQGRRRQRHLRRQHRQQRSRRRRSAATR